MHMDIQIFDTYRYNRALEQIEFSNSSSGSQRPSTGNSNGNSTKSINHEQYELGLFTSIRYVKLILRVIVSLCQSNFLFLAPHFLGFRTLRSFVDNLFLLKTFLFHCPYFSVSYLSNKRRVANKRRVWKKYLNLINVGSVTNEGPGIFVQQNKD